MHMWPEVDAQHQQMQAMGGFADPLGGMGGMMDPAAMIVGDGGHKKSKSKSGRDKEEKKKKRASTAEPLFGAMPAGMQGMPPMMSGGMPGGSMGGMPPIPPMYHGMPDPLGMGMPGGQAGMPAGIQAVYEERPRKDKEKAHGANTKVKATRRKSEIGGFAAWMAGSSRPIKASSSKGK